MLRCHIATVCCMYIPGHLDLFHRATSPLNWFKMVYMGDWACTFIRIKFLNMFFVIWNLWFPLKIYCSFNIEPHCFYVCVYQRWPLTLMAICRNMGISDVFTQVAVRKIYADFIWLVHITIDALRPRQNGHHYADATLKYVYLIEQVSVVIKSLLKFIPNRQTQE